MKSTPLPTSKTSPYDVVIVGAGINGCCCAYYLHQAGLKVALVDQRGIASGGSGAAGAFISPKFNKQGLLKEIMDAAYNEAITFYTTVLAKFTLLKSLHHTPLDNSSQTIYLERSAIVSAKKSCEALSEGIDLYIQEVNSPTYENGVWICEGIQAKHILLAIGAYPKIFPIDYVGLRGIWGHRVDVTTTTKVEDIHHYRVSVSPTLEDGVVAVGATHNVHYSPFDPNTEYDLEAGRSELIKKADDTYKLNNIKILKDYTGLRSGSNDYLPMLGPLVDAQATLQKHPHLIHGKAVDPKEFVYYPELTMVNGSGGYGFVLAPYLAKLLKGYLVDGVKMPEELSPSRFFPRWAKRHS